MYLYLCITVYNVHVHLGGKYFVTGGTDHIIRVYICIPGPPTLQAELEEPHTVRTNTAWTLLP